MKDKLCKYCKNKSVTVEYLGKSPKTGNKLFSSICSGCGYEYIFMINPETNAYIRTGNINRVQI